VQESKVKRSDRLNDRVKTDGTDTTDRITFAANAVDTDLRVGDEGGVRELLRGSEFVDRSGRLLRLHDEASVETLAASATHAAFRSPTEESRSCFFVSPQHARTQHVPHAYSVVDDSVSHYVCRYFLRCLHLEF